MLKQMLFFVSFSPESILVIFIKASCRVKRVMNAFFSMNRMSLCGILILHVKRSWSVSWAMPDLAYKIVSLFLIPPELD